jgi:hypothetical protein
VLGTWSLVLSYFQYLVTEDLSTLIYYRHYLMFGLPSSMNAVNWFAGQPIYSLSLLSILLLTIPLLFGRTPNPALRVLLLTGILYLFWWIFYTPATIFRYMWYTCAILAIFSGPLIMNAYRTMRSSGNSMGKRLCCMVAILLILIPGGERLITQLDLIYVQDQAGDDRDLAEYVNRLPEETEIATAFWPLRKSLDFMTNRNVHVIEDLSQIDDKFDVIIYNVGVNPVDADTLEHAYRIGRYAILRTE